jgi:hypothetical protein
LDAFGEQERLNHRGTVDVDLNVASRFFAGSRAYDARIASSVVARIDLNDFEEAALLNV